MYRVHALSGGTNPALPLIQAEIAPLTLCREMHSTRGNQNVGYSEEVLCAVASERRETEGELEEPLL